MRLVVDASRCESHGQCEMTAPDLVQIGDDDVAVVLVDGDVPDEQLARRAVAACPVAALSLEG